MSKKLEKGTNIMLGAAPSGKNNKKRSHKTFSRTKSRLRQPEGPGSSTAPPEFDGSITLATDESTPARIWNASISGEGFEWADLASAIPTLLNMARRCVGIDSLADKAVLGLDICTNALSSCGSVRFEARRSVLMEEEYEFADVMSSIMSEDHDEKIDERVLRSVASLILVTLDLETGNKDDETTKRKFLKTLNKTDKLESFLMCLLSGSQSETILCGLRLASVVDNSMKLSSKTRNQIKTDYDRGLKSIKDENMRSTFLNVVSQSGKKEARSRARTASAASNGDKKCIVM